MTMVELISEKLKSLTPQPMAVHFYLGEGLRWIRVGFDGTVPLKPAAVKTVGRIIAPCVAKSGPLYFHALRPHDMLFFLSDGEEKSIGMPAECFGTPLEDVLRAWGVKGKSARPSR